MTELDKCPLHKIHFRPGVGCVACTNEGATSPAAAVDLMMKQMREIANPLPEIANPLPDNVNHPAHYNQGRIEVLEFLEDQKLEGHEWNAVKYICRAQHKGKRVEDLKKAIFYLKRKIYLLELKEGDKILPPNQTA